MGDDVVKGFVVIFLSLFLISFVNAAGNSFDNAEVIKNGGSLSGVPIQGETKHYYKIDLKDGDYFKVNNIVAYEEDGSFYDGSRGVFFKIYDNFRKEVSSSYISEFRQDSQLGYSLSSNDDEGEYYFVVEYRGDKQFVVEYSMDFSIENSGDFSGKDVPNSFSDAYKIDVGSYPDCCSLIAGSFGRDEKDTYKINVGKNEKLIVKITPGSDEGGDALLGLAIYNEDKGLEEYEVASDDGQVVELEYVSLEDQEVYFSALRDFNGAIGGPYGLDVSIKEATKDEIKLAKSNAAKDSDYSGSSRGFGKEVSGWMIILSIILNLLFFGLIVGIYFYFSLALMAIAKRAGVERRWFAWVPVLNLVLMANIAKMSAWLLFLLLVPVANIIIIGMIWWKIVEARGLSGGLGLLMFVPIANLILLGILAWKKDSMEKPKCLKQSGLQKNNKCVQNSSRFSERRFDSKNMKKSYMLIGALVIFAIAILLPWISVNLFIVNISISGWTLHWAVKILFFLSLGIAGFVYYKKKAGGIAALGLSILTIIGIVILLVSGINKLSGVGMMDSGSVFNFLGFGFYLFLASVIAVGVLGFIVMKSGNEGQKPTVKSKF